MVLASGSCNCIFWYIKTSDKVNESLIPNPYSPPLPPPCITLVTLLNGLNASYLVPSVSVNVPTIRSIGVPLNFKLSKYGVSSSSFGSADSNKILSIPLCESTEPSDIILLGCAFVGSNTAPEPSSPKICLGAIFSLGKSLLLVLIKSGASFSIASILYLAFSSTALWLPCSFFSIK